MKSILMQVKWVEDPVFGSSGEGYWLCECGKRTRRGIITHEQLQLWIAGHNR